MEVDETGKVPRAHDQWNQLLTYMRAELELLKVAKLSN